MHTKQNDYNCSEAAIHKLCASLISNLYYWSVNGTSIGVVSGLDDSGIKLMEEVDDLIDGNVTIKAY